MCGRYTLTAPERIPDVFEVDEVRIDPRFNIAPTQEVPGVTLARDGRRQVDLFRWGLIPFWADDEGIGNKLINARSESAREKPAFKHAFKKRRCLVPADGYFEWRKQANGKQPFLFRLRDGGLFAFAGLWEYWRNPGGEPVISLAILTTDSNRLTSHVHDRMPAILPRESYQSWLAPNTPLQELDSLLAPYPSKEMEATPVSREVNSPRNDRPEIIRPAKVDEPLDL